MKKRLENAERENCFLNEHIKELNAKASELMLYNGNLSEAVKQLDPELYYEIKEKYQNESKALTKITRLISNWTIITICWRSTSR